jgi:DNA-binding CsgD family transcriptional regulator/tetratricopeptide (TPR) repeat protein
MRGRDGIVAHTVRATDVALRSERAAPPGAARRAGHGLGTQLHGRTAEVDALSRLVAEVRSGRGAAVIVEGEAGIGKSRMLAELARSAEAEGWICHVGRCEELDQLRPFGVWRDLFDLRAASGDPERAELGRLLRGDGAPVPEGLPMAAEGRFRILDGISAIVERAATCRPVVVVLDDVHWADDETLLTAAAIARRTADLPVLLALASRPVPRSSTLTSVTRALTDRGAAQLVLDPLEPGAVVELVADLLDCRPGSRLVREVARAAGNPFFTIEFVASLAREHLLVRRADEVDLFRSSLPSALQQTLLERLEHLNPDTVELLQLGSVIGRTFSVELIAAVSGRGPAELARAVAEALRAAVLSEELAGLEFRHDLLREAIYHALPTSVRSHLHAEVARALAARGASAVTVAAQFQLAENVAGDEIADWLERAADETFLTAPRTAASFLRHLLDTLAEDDERRPSFLGRLVTCEVFSGQLRGAESLARHAIERMEILDDAHADVAYALGQSLFLQGRLAEAAEVYERVAREAPGLRAAMVLADAAFTSMFSGELDRSIELAEESRRLAGETEDVTAETAALCTLAIVVAQRGDLEGGLALGRRAVISADTAGSVEAHRNTPYLFLADIQLWADHIDDCRTSLERAHHLGRRLRLGWDEPIRQSILAELLFRLGDWEEAEVQAEAALEQSLDLGAGFADAWLRVLLATIAVYRRDLSRADEELAAAERLIERGVTGSDRCFAARILAVEAAGDVSTASGMSAMLWDELAKRDLVVPMLCAAPDVVRVARRTGDRALTARVIDAMQRAADQMPDSVAPALALRCRGIVERDAAVLVRAAALLRARQRPVSQSFALWEAASILGAAGDQVGARQLFDQAAVVLGPIGAKPFPVCDDEVPAAVRSGGARFGWESLTDSELRVVNLVGAGLSNAEISTRLICSRRTVESHLHHVYTKLGIGSRVALAVEARSRSGQ